MLRLFALIVVGLLFLNKIACATERNRIGYGHLATNDIIGDGKDRWRSASAASSRIWGPRWTGHLPPDFGHLIELRLGAELMTPDNLTVFDGADRRYATSFSIGPHTHFSIGKTEISTGMDLVVIGPQTGLSRLQTAFHEKIKSLPTSQNVLDKQIGNSIHFSPVIELGRPFYFGKYLNIRPFLETRTVTENLLRTGFDFTFGGLGKGELLIRDPVTGQRYRAITTNWSGVSAVLGADVTYINSSLFFPPDGPARLRKRERLRMGLHWQGNENTALFYGLTWLGREFDGQKESQFVGSARIKFKF